MCIYSDLLEALHHPNTMTLLSQGIRRPQTFALPQGVQQAGRVEEKEERGKKRGIPLWFSGPGRNSTEAGKKRARRARTTICEPAAASAGRSVRGARVGGSGRAAGRVLRRVGTAWCLSLWVGFG